MFDSFLDPSSIGGKNSQFSFQNSPYQSPPRSQTKSRYSLGTPPSGSPTNLSFGQSLSTSYPTLSKPQSKVESRIPLLTNSTPRTLIKNITKSESNIKTPIKILTKTATTISEKIQEAQQGLNECKRLLERREQQERGWDEKISTLINDFNKQIKFKEGLQEKLQEMLQSSEQEKKEITQIQNNIIDTNSDLNSVDTRIQELDQQINELYLRLSKSEQPRVWRKNLLLLLLFIICVLLATWISLYFSGLSFSKAGLKTISPFFDTSEHFLKQNSIH